MQRSRIRSRAAQPSNARVAASNPARALSNLMMPGLALARGQAPSWVSAVSSLNAAGNLGTFVLYQGDGTGWLYSGNTTPKMVSVIAQQQGGPTGLLVRTGPAAAQANPRYGNRRYSAGPVYGNGSGAINDNYAANARVAASGAPVREHSNRRVTAKRIGNPPVAGGGTVVAELPRAPDPTAGCCIVEEDGTFTDPDTGVAIATGGYVQCPGGAAQWSMHGRPIPTVTMSPFDQNGQRMIMVETGDGSFTLPSCSSPPPPPGVDEIPCCVDRAAMRLVCQNAADPLHDAVVTRLMEVTGDGLQSLMFVDPRDGAEKGIRLRPCDVPPPGQCCYDATMSMLVCTAGDPRDGMAVTAQSSFVQPDGQRIVVVRLPDGSALDAPACEAPPDRCCYDVATGTLRCPRNEGLNGQQVSLVAMTQQPDGSIIAIVQIQGQSGISTFPVCDDRVSDCCYDAANQTISCPNDAALNGTAAAIVASWKTNEGVVWVWATWPGGGARMPLCPGQLECPPVFCCVNVETLKFVCPGRTDVNGRDANLINILTDGGFNWGVLADGSRVALCGRDCPPPEMCPDCPGCPPGMWMSPDGTCILPPKCPPPGNCPQCPPGTLLNTQTGECVRCGDRQPCPPYPGRVVVPSMPLSAAMRARVGNPKKKACCDDCAKNNPCTGCGDKAKAPNPRRRLVFGRRSNRR